MDVFQPCVSFNKQNTYSWFKEHTYYLDESHDPSNRTAAFAKATETTTLPLGIFYINPKKTFEDNLGIYNDNSEPLFRRNHDLVKLAEFIAAKR